LSHHVLYGILSKSSKKEEKFNDFNEYLKTLNVNILDSYFDQLKENGIEYSEFNQLKSYICLVKNKGNWFSKMLINSF